MTAAAEGGVDHKGKCRGVEGVDHSPNGAGDVWSRELIHVHRQLGPKFMSLVLTLLSARARGSPLLTRRLILRGLVDRLCLNQPSSRHRSTA